MSERSRAAVSTEVGDDPVVTYLAEMGDEFLHSLNREFGDAMTVVGRVLGGAPEATVARATAIDGRGVDAIVEEPTGERAVRIEFDEPVLDAELLTTALLGLVAKAQAESGEEGVTAVERELAQAAAIRTFLTRVVAVTDIHPHLRQVTFGGGDLETFAPAGPDTFLYLLVPPAGRTELGIDQSFTWEAHARMAEEDKPVGAYYTLRRWRPEVAELDILMVLHGDAGPASAWAGRVTPGDPVALWGPRTAYHPPDGTDHLVLVADETGLPAVAVILEAMAPGTTATVLAEVGGADEHQDLPSAPGIDVTWLHRDGAEAGTTTLLADAVRALPPFAGVPYVWGGGESRAMTQVRRHVRDERGLEREAVSLVGYWRHRSTPDDAVED